MPQAGDTYYTNDTSYIDRYSHVYDRRDSDMYGETIKITQRGDDLSQPSLPTAEVGINVPYVIGTTRVFKPNVIWHGAVTPITKTTKTKEDVNCRYEKISNVVDWIYYYCDELITTTKTIVGYKLPIALGVCLGEEAKLRAVYVNDKKVRTLVVTKFDSVSWGDDYSKYIGDYVFFRGDYDQPINAAANFSPGDHVYDYGGIVDKQNGVDGNGTNTIGAMPGISYVYIPEADLVDLSESRYSFEIERRPNPLGLSTSTNEIGEDINIATAIYDFVTSEWGGMGVPTTKIDSSSFVTAAAIFKAENNGVSYQINNPTSAKSVLEMLLGQAGAMLYENPATGKFTLKVIRFSLFDDEDTFALTEQNVSRVNNWERQSWAQTFNKLRLTYTDRNNDYKEASLVAYNFASEPDNVAEDRAIEVSYPACCSLATAKKLLTREMQQLSQPKIGADVTASREASDLNPGDSVSLHLPRHGIKDAFVAVVMSVGRLSLTDNKVNVKMVQINRDDFEIAYADPDESLATNIEVDRDPPTALKVYQAPFFFAQRFNIIDVQSTYQNVRNYLIPLGFATPDDALQTNFRLFISNEPDVGIMQTISDGVYPSVGLLQSGIDEFDNYSDMIIPSMTLTNVLQDGFIESVGTTGIDRGDLLIFINDEILTCGSVTDNGDGTYTFTNVHRMILDTKPGTHAAGATVYVFNVSESNLGRMEDGPPLGYTPTFRAVSRVEGLLNDYGDETDANEYYQSTAGYDLTINRLMAPYRPIAPSITTDGLGDGAYGRPTSADDDARLITGQAVAMTWKNRSRETPTVSIYADAGEEIERDYTTEPPSQEYVKHKITIRDSADDEYDGATTTDGLANNDTSLSTNVPAIGVEGECRIYVKAFNDFEDSIYHEELVVIVYDTGWMIDEGETFEFVSEDGAFIFAGE